MKEKAKILIIDNSCDVTGALKSITNSARSLQTYFDFEFLIPQNSKARPLLEKMGFPDILELRMVEISKRLSAVLYAPLLLINSFLLIGKIRQRRIALIHVNDLYNLLPVMIRLLGNKTPYICHVRFMPDRFPPLLLNFWLKLHLRYAKNIIAVSKSVWNLLPQHPKIVMIYDRVPFDESNHPVGSAGLNKPDKVFLYLSNFSKGKGQDLALEAFAEIHRTLPDWKLRMVGSDMGLRKNRHYAESLKIMAEKLRIAEKIEWAEFTNDVEREYRYADVVLNFSESESFSKTCLEALFYGRPLIASDCGGPSEIIENDVTGILVPNRNKAEMARAMKKVALDMRRSEEMALRGQLVVREKFQVENTTLKLKEIYNNALTCGE